MNVEYRTPLLRSLLNTLYMSTSVIELPPRGSLPVKIIFSQASCERKLSGTGRFLRHGELETTGLRSASTCPSRDSLNVLVMCGFKSFLAQMHCTVAERDANTATRAAHASATAALR